MARQKLQAVVLAGLMLGSVLAGSVVLSSGTTRAAGNATDARIEVVDVGQRSGDLTVTVRGTSSEAVTDLNFTYRDLSGGGTLGPLEYSNASAFTGASYDNGSAYAPGDPVHEDAGKDGTVTFVFDSSESGFDYVGNAFRVNVTGYDADYGSADTGNRSVITANHYRANAQDHNGSPLTSAPVMVYSADGNASGGFAFASGSPAAFHCRGVNVSGTCTDPDTGSAGAVTPLGSPSSAPAPVTFQTFALSQSNASAKTEPGGRGTLTLTADTPTAPVFAFWDSVLGGNPRPNVDNVTVTRGSTGTVVYEETGASFESITPVFLEPNVRYVFSFENSSAFGTVNRSLVLPTKGTTGAQFNIATGSVATSEVAGQVVDENGNAVSDAVVTAQPERAGGNQVQVYNSTTTDANGLFSMQVPETSQFPEQGLSFRVVGTDTSGGTPIYYPTTDANDGEGYTVRSSKTVLPRMVLQQGGRVGISVTSSQPTLPVTDAFSSLSQVSSAYPALTRTANANTFTTLGFGGQTPSSASVAFLAPTTDSDTQVAYNVWGLGTRNGEYLCAETVAVSQGTDTASTCRLDDGGYINLTVDQYGSIVQQGSASAADVQDFGFFFENELVVRNDTTGDIVTYLDADGAQQFFLSRTGPTTNVNIPVPAGDYQLELRSREADGEWTTVNDSARVRVDGGSTTDVSLDRGRSFPIRPVFSRFDRSLRRSADNTLAVRVADPATGSLLTGTELDASARLLYPNGTTASDRVSLSYNSSDRTFDTSTFNPSTLGVDAGNYDLAVTASHASGTRTYNTTVGGPVQVTGVRTSLSFSSRTVAPGSTLLGRIQAYDGRSGLSTTADEVDVSVYDENGRRVSSTAPDSGLSSGEGSFDVSMPDDPGRYRVVATVDTGSKQGIAQRAVRVSDVDLSVTTNKRVYEPTDTVTVSVTAEDATTGKAVSDATVELRINRQRNVTSTDANGESTVLIDSGKYGNGSAWDEGHPVTVTLTRETSSGVTRKTVGTGFEVQTFETRATATDPSFAPTEPATVDVLVPPGLGITTGDVTVTEIDGDPASIGGSSVTNPTTGVFRVDLGQLSVGDHVVTAEVDAGAAGVETATARVPVKSVDVSTSLNRRLVGAGDPIEVSVGVRKPDGTAVSGQSVDVSLNASGPGAVDSASGTTDAGGTATFSLSSSTGGEHAVEVTVGQQTRYVGVFVSDVSVRLEDGSGSPVERYQAEPGTTETLYVNATTAAGADVPDGSNVTAFATVFDRRVELGSATTTGGDASIDFDIPASVPAREYGLGVAVTTTDGVGSTTGVLNVTGTTAKQIAADTNESAYAPGETARLSATVRDGDGTPLASEAVDFVVQAEGGAETRVGTVSTGSDGVATFDYDVPTGASDGQYVLEAELNGSETIQAYSGYRVRSFDVSVEAEDGPFAPGDTVSLTVYANDTSGTAISATGGSLTLVLPGANAEKSLSLSGSAPYDVSVTVPSDGGVTGTRPVGVTVQQGSASDTDSTLVEVRNDSESANLSVARPVTAGQATTVTVNGTVDTTATLTAFSPNAESVAFNDSVSVSSSGDTTASMTIDSPGIHVVKLSVPNVGTLTEVVDVQPASGNPTVWTGTDLGSNTTDFTTSETIYVKTNTAGKTATVVSEGSTYEVTLDQQSGDTYYGTLTTSRPSGVYLVRLDSADATGIDDTVVEVSG